MKVSEKTLELNIGAELLQRLRRQPGLQKTYLRGLTQAEERSEGVDFFAQLDPKSRLFAFQFKAPKGRVESLPYRYTVVDYQHHALYALAQMHPGSVFYVFPFFVTPSKVHSFSPTLLSQTWFADIAEIDTAAVFRGARSRTIQCVAGHAYVNPEYSLRHGLELLLDADSGIRPAAFAEWYRRFRLMSADDTNDEGIGRRNPWLARALRLAVAIP